MKIEWKAFLLLDSNLLMFYTQDAFGYAICDCDRRGVPHSFSILLNTYS